MSKLNAYPTEYQLSNLVDLQKSLYHPASESSSKKIEKQPTRPEDEKNINLLLCWAY